MTWRFSPPLSTSSDRSGGASPQVMQLFSILVTAAYLSASVGAQAPTEKGRRALTAILEDLQLFGVRSAYSVGIPDPPGATAQRGT
jgi:hypothetical protein